MYVRNSLEYIRVRGVDSESSEPLSTPFEEREPRFVIEIWPGLQAWHDQMGNSSVVQMREKI